MTDDPFALFGEWYHEAEQCKEIADASAVNLATASPLGTKPVQARYHAGNRAGTVAAVEFHIQQQIPRITARSSGSGDA